MKYGKNNSQFTDIQEGFKLFYDDDDDVQTKTKTDSEHRFACKT